MLHHPGSTRAPASAWQARLDAAERLIPTDALQATVLLQGIIQLVQEQEDLCALAPSLTLLGEAFLARGDLPGAQDAFSQGRDTAVDVDDGVTQARALNGLGLVARAQGQYGEAMEHYLTSLHVAQAHGDDAGQARTLGNIGQVQADLGDDQLALQTFQERRLLAERAGHAFLQSCGAVDVVFALHELGRYDEVLETAAVFLPFIQAQGLTQLEMVLQLNVMASLTATGRAARAVLLGDHVKALAAQSATREQFTHFRLTYGHALLKEGRLHEAEALLEQALAAARSDGSAPQERLILGHLSELYARRNEWERAYRLSREAQVLDGQRRVQDLDRKARVLSVQLHNEMLAREAERTAELTRMAEELTAAQQHLAAQAEQARQDPLTGLPGRTQFQADLDRRLAEAGDAPLGVLFIDLDHFKAVNDALGHALGDRLLQHVARRLTAAVPGSGMVARTGGDEFTVTLGGLAAEEAERVSKAILTSLAAPFDVDGHTLHVTASIGVAIAPRDGRDVTALQKHTDIAMYRAKTAGRNRVRMYEPGMGSESAQRLMLDRDLRAALATGELLLHYQSVVEAVSGQPQGFEALVRWAHPQQGLISPGQFIPVAEETGLIVPMGTWVLGEACRQAAAWQGRGQALTMSVNVSARQFEQPDFVAIVRDALAESGLDPRLLILELTERVVLRNPDAAVVLLHDLRALGIRIALDDFGTGYSSLGLLKTLPIDVLKIDRSFVQGDRAEVMVGAIVSLAHAFGLTVIAEGVETAEQLALVQALHCNGVQGYLFARPGPAHEVMPL
ncbi:EAL domain-containing protein [Deinococcus enclensis]|uniref:Diguanylate cyclase (GGDEF)-like protein n=1 Tax=Deinococcus enclensis TaxID=1049582 RepID=A0ABT9MEX9_9DEIO|nr:EAL domain-containing protein [Deinococcus enclensis]MDP9765155.1 diguanylate cyclase (GGDEF)-like protein [Deinococcus enclensis]